MIEESLAKRQADFLARCRGLRRPETKNLFELRLLIGPEDLRVAGFKKRPVATFNPAALVEGRELVVYPRLIFDYYKYVSSVGVFRLGLEEAIGGSLEGPLETRIILWPQELWEFLGCEDPRAYRAGEAVYLLYTGKGFLLRGGAEGRRARALRRAGVRQARWGDES